MQRRAFVKGHGTENDFVLLPDADGQLGPAGPNLVRALCDRRAGLGADGVIRVVRTTACDDPHSVAARGSADWFMDYANADGSVSEMCGNGIRVLGRYLLGLLPPGTTSIPIATRDGVKTLTVDGDELSVDLGIPVVGGPTSVGVGEARWQATRVSTGNPHAVTFVDDLADAGTLLDPPVIDAGHFPEGANVEFVVRRGDRHLAMRVHERGSGETRSCGTGAAAVMAAAATDDGAPAGTTYVVDVPGGRLRVTWTEAGRLVLTGPAVLVAEGYWVAP